MSLIFVGRIMNWTEEHDVVFCREIIFVNPFSAKKKSVQRSALWQRVADTLNSIKDPVFFVDKRSVRDHIGVLVQRLKRKEAKELKESGISPTKTELDEAIEQIIAMEESADEQHDLEDGEKRDKMEGDRLKAEEMRRTAMETLGKTQKRKSEEGQSKAKKSRRSGSETVEFLKLKAEQDMDIKKQELDLRKQEQEKMAIAQNQQTYMFNQMLKQQQEQHKQMHDMQSLLMQQQQLQTTAMMKIIETLVQK